MSRHLSFNSNHLGASNVPLCIACASLLLATFHCMPLRAQVANGQSSLASPPSSPDTQHMADIERRLNDVTSSLTQTQQALEQSLLEIQRLRAELDALRLQAGNAPTNPPASLPAKPTAAPAQNAAGEIAAGASSSSDDLKALHD